MFQLTPQQFIMIVGMAVGGIAIFGMALCLVAIALQERAHDID